MADGEFGACVDPAEIVNPAGVPVMVMREDGLWGGPELTEEQRLAAFGQRARPR